MAKEKLDGEVETVTILGDIVSKEVKVLEYFGHRSAMDCL